VIKCVVSLALINANTSKIREYELIDAQIPAILVNMVIKTVHSVILKGDLEITRESIMWCCLVELLIELSNECFDHLKK